MIGNIFTLTGTYILVRIFITVGMRMEDLAGKRREYVSQVRSSFETGEITDESVKCVREVKWWRLRLLVAILLFVAFFFWHSSGIQIQEIKSTKIIDMIEDNRYDKLLQDYLKKGNIQ